MVMIHSLLSLEFNLQFFLQSFSLFDLSITLLCHEIEQLLLLKLRMVDNIFSLRVVFLFSQVAIFDNNILILFIPPHFVVYLLLLNSDNYQISLSKRELTC